MRLPAAIFHPFLFTNNFLHTKNFVDAEMMVSPYFSKMIVKLLKKRQMYRSMEILYTNQNNIQDNHYLGKQQKAWSDRAEQEVVRPLCRRTGADVSDYTWQQYNSLVVSLTEQT